MNTPNPSGPVLVIGSASVDTIARAAGPLSTGSSAPGRIRRAFGGVARNTAENLARLGVPTVLLTAVGDDEDGRSLLAHAASVGIDTAHTLVVPGASTGGFLAVLDERAALHVAVDQMSAIAALTPRFLREKKLLFKEAACVMIDANLAPEAIAAVISLARSAKLPICADPTSVPLAPRLIPHLDDLALLISNAAEAAAICDCELAREDSDRAVVVAKDLVARGVELAVVTLGEFGVGYATAEVSGHIPALRAEVVDSTGAGDAFTAAVIFGLLHEVPVDEAVSLGVSAAALTLRSNHTVVPELSEELLYEQLVI